MIAFNRFLPPEKPLAESFEKAKPADQPSEVCWVAEAKNGALLSQGGLAIIAFSTFELAIEFFSQLQSSTGPVTELTICNYQWEGLVEKYGRTYRMVALDMSRKEGGPWRAKVFPLKK